MDGTIDTIGSDHGPYRDEEKTKEGDFFKELCGFGGFDGLLPSMLTEGVNKRGLPLERLADLTSGNAAKIMGLYPKKGSLLTSYLAKRLPYLTGGNPQLLPAF